MWSWSVAVLGAHGAAMAAAWRRRPKACKQTDSYLEYSMGLELGKEGW